MQHCRNHVTTPRLPLNPPSSDCVRKSLTTMNRKVNRKVHHFVTTTNDRKFRRNFDHYNKYIRLRSMSQTNTASTNIASTETTTNTEDFSKFSINELKQLATKSLRQNQRQPPNKQPSPTNHTRTKQILECILERATDDNSISNIQNIQTSLIDSWTTFQSSIIKNMIETNSDQDGELSYHQRLQLRDVCFAAESMTQILESMKDPTQHHYVAILKAWANACKIAKAIGKSKVTDVIGIPQRTQLILNAMEGEPGNTNNNISNNNVSVEAYNEVIKAWAYSSEYLRGTMAEQVFQKVQFPTGESLRLIMRAHAWSNENRSAFQATGHFMRMMRLLEAGRDDMEPSSIDDYHILCEAWTKAGDKNSSSKVHSVLQIMGNAYEKGHTDICADLQCYRDALITMSHRQNVEDVGYLADETLREMKEKMIIPDTICYRSAILAWRNVALSRDNPHPDHAIRRAQELLEEMTEAYHRTTEFLIQPTTEDYNHVLQAMMLSKTPQAVDYAQGLLNKLNEDGSSTGGPDVHSYRYLLGILRNSRSPTKLTLATKLRDEVMYKYANDENFKPSKESVMDVFTAFVRVCGAPAIVSKNISNDLQQDRTKIMTMALEVLEDSKKFGLTLNSDTYTALIEACDNLLPVDGQERENVLSNIFCRACEEGFVNQSLLESFKSAASTFLYANLVVSKSTVMEDIKIVPESWTRNVEGHREGNQVMPLSIHGDFTFTQSAAEYRMRKLRRRKNQKFLRGGRLKKKI